MWCLACLPGLGMTATRESLPLPTWMVTAGYSVHALPWAISAVTGPGAWCPQTELGVQ